MLTGTAGVVGNAQREQADGSADVRAYAATPRFAFDGIAEKLHPAFYQRHFVRRRLRDFVACAQDPHERFKPLQALHQASQQVRHSQACPNGRGAATDAHDDFIALFDQYQKLLLILDRGFTASQIAAIRSRQLVRFDGECQKWRIAFFDSGIEAYQFRLKTHRADTRRQMVAGVEHLRKALQQGLLIAHFRHAERLPEAHFELVRDCAQPFIVVETMKNEVRAIPQVCRIGYRWQQPLDEAAPQFREKPRIRQNTAIGIKTHLTPPGEKREQTRAQRRA